ncbi:MAG TPA: valine--tRNA ligase [Luteibaculaceae bacterium]|nr:valine--tRNA ligase [Luteibaculaceae bacterium]
MEIPSKYDPTAVEDKWNSFWAENELFRSTPDDRPSYTVVIPPPNVTGVLHMGHMLNNTIQDVCVRRARQMGYNACWVPGTDHASIATEAKVVQLLRQQGIKKSDLSREDFLKHAFEWKDKYGGIILSQLRKLGASVDWKRTAFTMDDAYYQAVIRVFVDLHKKGYIYRGLRMINWDCEAKTALSNEEVIYQENGETSLLYHVRYAIEGSGETLTIATQRPETIMGDVAIAVNPSDERYKHLIGHFALVPMIDRRIPIIADDYVEKDFGTGCLKVTPAHDPNDYEIGQRHKLPVIDTINDDGTLNEKCELPEYVGLDRFEVRKKVVARLKTEGLLVKEEEFITRIGRSERTQTVVEPKLSLQWFIKMKDISQQALQAVESDEIKLHPAKFKNTYRHWMENVRDWCISRQLWWGHRIPAYYFGSGENDFVVAESETEARHQAADRLGINPAEVQLRQDEDVLDTWASSWLWPIAVFDGFNDDYFDKKTGKINLSANKELSYYYPTKVLVTAPEILFFWVARMIIAGYEYLDMPPFADVYLHGIVRDKQGRKMSKSLGNSPDPLDLIKTYGADGTRVGMLLSSPAGNDLLFDESLCEQGRNFSNKIWNAFRLVSGWEAANIEQPASASFAIEWFESRFNQQLQLINESYDKYRISEALMITYKLIWDDFCSWYLELIKPAYQQPIDLKTLSATKKIFERILGILHPFMPFITEEIWQYLTDDQVKTCCSLSQWPTGGMVNQSIIDQFESSAQVIAEIRTIRLQNNLPNKEKLTLFRRGSEGQAIHEAAVQKLGGLEQIIDTADKVDNAYTFISGRTEFFIPFGQNVDIEAERQKLQDELTYTLGFLELVMKKLNNEKFVSSAPAAVIDNERKKKEDAESKIAILTDKLSALK